MRNFSCTCIFLATSVFFSCRFPRKATFVLWTRSGLVALDYVRVQSWDQREFVALSCLVSYRWITTPDFMEPPNLVNLSSFFEMTILYNKFWVSKSAPNDSARIRRLTGIFRSARVKIFILLVAYRSFWLQLSWFSSNLTGHHETKTAKPIWGCRSNIQTFISNLGYLWLTRTSLICLMSFS